MFRKLKQKYNIQTKLGPTLGISLSHWMKLMLMNGSIPLRYYPRILTAGIIGTFGSPFRFYESRRLDKKINQIEISKPPVFILGHWRTGTTHLHNLLCQNPRFGWVTMLQAAFPRSFMSTNVFKNLMKKIIPKTRPMDNMKMGVFEAQEEEMALGNLFPYSFYNAFYFPLKMKEHYYKFIRFRSISNKILTQWKKVYYNLLQKTTLYMNGKRLILKNPANTARIQYLLELFPDAKFIHIYRNPYVVYASTRNFYKKAIEGFMLQKISDSQIEENVFWLYKQMMKCYFDERKLIPSENLVEVKFENLEQNPIQHLESIFTRLKLKNFERIRSKFRSYIEGIKNYKKNKYKLNDATIEKIYDQWGFTIEKWDYEVPTELVVR